MRNLIRLHKFESSHEMDIHPLIKLNNTSWNPIICCKIWISNFKMSAQNFGSGYSKETSRWNISFDYPQPLFWAEIRKLSQLLFHRHWFVGLYYVSLNEEFNQCNTFQNSSITDHWTLHVAVIYTNCTYTVWWCLISIVTRWNSFLRNELFGKHKHSL